ncbi:UDP-N-acetylmuramoyl-L-alanine--D-glutamate ligase [Candidatus Roizmanbacteria bacterium]|nr:UDP-N-acetylmuramoyl-L-alanine--D-glutamate ligase [Candidatus Roizmanbacteria bacterium]
MKLDQLKKYKKILILGYGKEGQATERFLKKFVPTAEIGVADKKFDLNYLNQQKNYDLVIRSPGVPKKLVTIPYTTATNIFFGNCRGQIIGVTGSKGKSTTASLIYAILKNAKKKVKLCGNIGRPMLLELLEPMSREDIFVCELSSYQLDDIEYSPHISVITNLFPEHMNYHGDTQKYYQAKKNITKYLSGKDYFVYNSKFSQLKSWTKNLICKTIPFEQNIPIVDKDIHLIGEHNLENIDEAAAVAKIFNIPDEIIKNTVLNFQPLPHRLELVGKFKNILFYDDAISTTPESTICAINSFPKIGTIFLGGFDRGYDFGKLSRVIIDKKIPNIVLFPDSGNKIFALLNKVIGFKFNFLKTKSMEEAVVFAYENTQAKTVCLLSTASPSYSLWKNFEEKGDLFQFFVKKYQCLSVPGRFNNAVS